MLSKFLQLPCLLHLAGNTLANAIVCILQKNRHARVNGREGMQGRSMRQHSPSTADKSMGSRRSSLTILRIQGSIL